MGKVSEKAALHRYFKITGLELDKAFSTTQWEI